MAINQTLKDSLIEKIRDSIIAGDYSPGEKLRQEELASHFGVSAVPVREALRQLEAEGLVTSLPRRGVVVTCLDEEDMRDIYDIRITLETMATRIATPKMNEETLNRLACTIEKMDQHPDEPAHLTQLNHEFHLTIYEASGRRYLCDLITMLRRRTQHYVRAHIHTMNAMPKSQEQHRAILAACQAGDAETAGNLMKEHLSRVGDELVSYVQDL